MFSWYLLLVYTRYYSNPTAVSCAGNITLFPHQEHNHGFPDFPVQQYSFSIFYQLFCIFSWFCQAFHIIYVYQVYYTVRIGILQFYRTHLVHTHLVHIYVVGTYSSLPVPGTPGIIRRMIFITRYLFERSEFLIDTSQKKSLRVCTRARSSTSLGLSVSYYVRHTYVSQLGSQDTYM